jgi:hypothetical protein
LLDVAIQGKGAFRRFEDVLADHRDERERWFAFPARFAQPMRTQTVAILGASGVTCRTGLAR